MKKHLLEEVIDHILRKFSLEDIKNWLEESHKIGYVSDSHEVGKWVRKLRKIRISIDDIEDVVYLVETKDKRSDSNGEG